MYDAVKIPVSISHRTDATKYYDTSMSVEHLSVFERMMSAFGALVICWFAALVCVAIPVMHFVLVPLGLIAGVVAFIYKATRHERRLATEFKCPACQTRLQLKPASFNWPIHETCGECRAGLVIDHR